MPSEKKKKLATKMQSITEKVLSAQGGLEKQKCHKQLIQRILREEPSNKTEEGPNNKTEEVPSIKTIPKTKP